jgi:epoxyqueuosine reductase
MLNSAEIKKKAGYMGADLCGIAPIDRFINAPAGFHPHDVFKDTKSVISVACRIPEGPVTAENLIPYFVSEEIVTDKLNRIVFELSLAIEDSGFSAVIVPSSPYDYWDEEQMEGKGILSLKHIAYYAGLGYIGRNSLLCNKKYGNLIKLGAILTDAELKSDEMYAGDMCENCGNLCELSCPVNAISNKHVSQKECRPYSEVKNKRGADIYTCNICRKVCPNRNGISQI